MTDYSLPAEFIGRIGDGLCTIAVPQALTPQSTLAEILCLARAQQATDVHCTVGRPVMFKIDGKFQQRTMFMLTREWAQKTLLEALLTREQQLICKQRGDFECVHVIEGLGRFRVTILQIAGGIDVTVRLIIRQIPSFEESGMPAACRDLMNWSQGMVLVTGPAGCGKTTTLAVLAELINQTRTEHMIGIEQLIEIVFVPQECHITQRQIGLHTRAQDTALRAALREDPDIILISDLRDTETMQVATTAAETGHLVLGTMNTNDAIQTVSRLVNSFAPEDRSLMQSMLSESLRGVICQQRIARKDGAGMVSAYEVLVVNSGVGNLIHKGTLDKIDYMIETGKADGMVSFDQILCDMVSTDTITFEEGYSRCKNKQQIERLRFKRLTKRR